MAIKTYSGLCPTRVMVGVQIFMACLFSYMLRVNMSINIIAMVKPRTGGDGQVHVPECIIVNNQTYEKHNVSVATYDVQYDWDQQTQGIILGSYFWGYIATAIPGGYLAERWGPLHIIGCSSIVSGVLTALTPPAASIHYSLVIITRFIIGFAGGVVYPALHCLISRWAPPTEKGRFFGALFGGNFGTVITWPALGAVLQHMGWTWAFYIPGGLCLIWCGLWYFLVANSPADHRMISQKEREYIETCIGDTLSKEKRVPPYWSIAKSGPFWALAALHFGNLWGLYFLMTAGPKFIAEVLGFELRETGELAALPYLSRMTFGFIFGAIGDTLRARKIMTVTQIRKWFIIFSHFIPGMLLLCQIFIGCNIAASIAFVTMSLGFNGASGITNLQNSQDLAPNFAGTLYGIINCIGGTTGFITPMLTGFLTKEHNGMDEWKLIFTIGASVYIGSGIIFCLFGSGNIQPWNYTQETGNQVVGQDNKAFEQAENIPNLNLDNQGKKIDEEINTKI